MLDGSQRGYLELSQFNVIQSNHREIIRDAKPHFIDRQHSAKLRGNSSPRSSTSIRYSISPHLSSLPLHQPPPRNYLKVNDHTCWIFRGVRSAQQAEITQLVQAAIGPPKHSVHSASRATPTHAAPRVPLLQGRITNPLSDQTPVPGPALHPHPQGTSADYPRLLLLGVPSGQTQARGLPLLLPEQSAAVHSPPPVVSARVRLPVQLLARRHAPVSVAPSPAL